MGIVEPAQAQTGGRSASSLSPGGCLMA
jgi:hypothetical protein